MVQIEFTLYTKTLFFLSILLFLHGYLFTNLLPVLAGTSLLIFLVYAKQNFQREIGEIQIQRTLIERLRFVNHPLHVKTVIQHNGGHVHLSVTDILPETATLLRGSNTISKNVTSLETINLEYQMQFSSRGAHHFTTVNGIVSDRWQLFTSTFSKKVQTDVIVHSDPNEIKKAKRASKTEHDTLALPSLIGTEITREMEGIREYLPGDLLRDIDWKASSRLQTLLTKTFQKKETLETVILLDCSRNMRRTTGKHAKIEHAMVIGIHLTNILQSMHHQVGLIAYDEFKILTNISPSWNYQRIFKELSYLPSIIKTYTYATPKPNTIDEFTTQEPEEHQRFLSTIHPFLAGGKRKIKHRIQATGIYEATKILFHGSKSKHLIIITDLETNRDALYAAVTLAHAQHYKIWLLTLFTPYYHLDTTQLSTDTLEKLYTFQMSREKLIHKLQKKQIEIIELSPRMEGRKIMETIRRKQI